MSDYRPRPRAFRLDDAGVAYDDRPAAAAPKAEVRTQTAPIPEKAEPEPLDEGERAIEESVSRRWRPTLATLRLGRARRPRLAGPRLVDRRSDRGRCGRRRAGLAGSGWLSPRCC